MRDVRGGGVTQGPRGYDQLRVGDIEGDCFLSSNVLETASRLDAFGLRPSAELRVARMGRINDGPTPRPAKHDWAAPLKVTNSKWGLPVALNDDDDCHFSYELHD